MDFSARSTLNQQRREGSIVVQLETTMLSNFEITVEELASSVLTDSLRSVRYWLKRAAREWTEDDEIVHQLRVSGRRALSAINLFEVFLPTSEGRWFRKLLKAILQAAGRARDLDVLLRIQLPRCGKLQKKMAKQWQAERAVSQKPLVALDRKLSQHDLFRNHIRSLVTNLKTVAADVDTGRGTQVVCDDRILSQFSDLCGSVVKALGIEADVRSLHKLRIAVKRLRYAADLLLPVLQRQQVRDMAKALARLQKQLGAMQDHVVAKQELKRSIKGLRRRSHRKLLRDLIESETRSIAEGVAKFHAWLDSDACRDLKQRIEALA